MTAALTRGQVWLVDLDPTRGHEQAGRRPALIISTDGFSRGPAGLVVVLPLTTAVRGIRWHVEVLPPEGGLRQRSFIKCEDVRSISTDRLVAPWGSVAASTLSQVEQRLRFLLEL